MSISQALRNSPKGQLQYSRNVGTKKLKDDLEKLSPIPLSRGHEERDWSKTNLSFGLDSLSLTDASARYNVNGNSTSWDSSVSEDPSCTKLCEVEGKEADNTIDKDGSRKSDKLTSRLDNSQPDQDPDETASSPHSQSNINTSSYPVSPLYGYTSKVIVEEEDTWQSAFRLRVLERLSQFDEHEHAVKYLMKQKTYEANQRLHFMKEQRQKLIEKQLQEGIEATQRILQRLKENREEHEQKIVTKHQEIQRQRVLLEQEERKRQEIKAAKMQKLREVLQQIEESRQQFGQLQDTFQHKDRFSQIIGKYRAALDKICAVLTNQLQTVEHNSVPLDDVIAAFEGHRDKSKNAVLYIKKEMAEIESSAKEEEDKKKEEAKKLEEEKKKQEESKKLEQEAAQDLGVQAFAYAIKEYKAKLQKVAETDAAIQNFVSNPQMKKYRFDLLRAINTPINAISAVSGSHLKDKLQRLFALLSGHSVSMSNKNISTGNSPDAPLFCQNLVAKMLVRKGEEQVTSKHESAFAIGMVVVGLWSQFPMVGELFMGHLLTLCPYVLPFYCPRQEGQASADYHRSLGYKVDEDGNIEEQDKYLRRMSGLMRLYCACLVAVPPKGPNSPHPHGLENAWCWLARTLNLEPHPDITAAMIHDVLTVTGNALLTEYKDQFVKLIYELQKSYLPKLKSVSVTNATVGRLELFLEATMKSHGRIPLPEGNLPSHFWTT